MVASAGLAGAQEYVTTIRGWYTTIERPLAGREPGWPVTIVAIERPHAPGPRIPTIKPPSGPHRLDGMASFYWQPQMTASGERFDPADLTAAHLTLPFGTRIRVTNTITGLSVIVRINDRGPYKAGRIIDLSDAAAGHLGMRQIGVAPVRIEVLAGKW